MDYGAASDGGHIRLTGASAPTRPKPLRHLHLHPFDKVFGTQQRLEVKPRHILVEVLQQIVPFAAQDHALRAKGKKCSRPPLVFQGRDIALKGPQITNRTRFRIGRACKPWCFHKPVEDHGGLGGNPRLMARCKKPAT